MTTQRNPFRRYGFAAASALLLGAACSPSKPDAGARDAHVPPAPAAHQGQELVTVQLCANRHDYSEIPTDCRTTTDPAALYQSVITRMKSAAHCPFEWSVCMRYPPVMWPAATGVGGEVEWNKQADRIMTFYRNSMGQDVTMRSYEFSLQKMREVARGMFGTNAPGVDDLLRSNDLLRQETLPGVLKQKAAEEGRAAQAEQAGYRKTLGEIDALTTTYQARVEAWQATYTALVAQFAAYRTNEPIILSRLQQLVQQASTATLATLPNVQLELVQLGRAESLAPQQLLSDAARLIAQLTHEHEQYRLALEPYHSFMQTQTLRRPDLTDTSLRVLRNMEGYADARYVRTRDIIVRTLNGVRRRHEALVAQAAEDSARATLVQASRMKASEDFVKEVNARVAAVSTLPPVSTGLELFYLAGKLQEHEGVLQLQPVCANVTSTPWMGTGCNLLALQFSKSSNYVTTTIPATIRSNVDLLRMVGVSEALLVDVEQHLAAHRLRAAAVAHDVAVRASDSLF